MLHTKDVQRINTHFCEITFSLKSSSLESNIAESVRSGQTADENIIRRIRIACWITNATDTYSEYEILFIHGKNGYAKAPQSYTIRTLHVLILCLCMCGLSTPKKDGTDRLSENVGKKLSLLAG